MERAKLRRVVRYHPSIGLSLLFRPLPKTEGRPRLDVEYRISEDHVLRFSAREALGVPEQTLLLVMLELCGEQFAGMGQAALLQESDERQLSNQLWTSLYPHGGAGLQPTVMIETTWEEVNRRCDRGKGGSGIRMRKEGMRRLCEVVVWEEVNQRRASHQSFLMVWLMGDDRRIHLALNFRLAAVFLGNQYAKVSLEERLRLGRDLPMFIHAFLSTCIRPGHQLKLGLETLATRIWPTDHDIAPEGTIRRRRSEMMRALNAIGRLPGWKVEWEGLLLTVHRAVPQRVREMPFAAGRAAATSFAEQDGVENGIKNKGLSQYDVSGLFNRT